jgi:AraC family carnitine catabolism transcriptional activator
VLQLSAAFVAECGQRPSAYLKRAQLERALQLLETTDLPLHEVARCAAFGTHVTFFRAFRRAFGCTPAQHRSRVSK